MGGIAFHVKLLWYAHLTHPHLLSFFTKTPLLHSKNAHSATQNHLFCKLRKILLQARTSNEYPLQLTMVWRGRSNERPYGLVGWLVRGRHKARPLQLTMVWCGRTNVRPYRLSEFRLRLGIYQGMHVCSSAIVSQSSCSNNPPPNSRDARSSVRSSE